MKVIDFESAIIAACLINDPSEQKKNIRLLTELSDDKFSEHRKLVYAAILDCFTQGKSIDILTIGKHLGEDLERIGGMKELRFLASSLERLGIPIASVPSGLGTWAQVVDDAGRLHQVGLVANEYAYLATDYEQALDKIEDVDAFIADFMTKLRQSQGLLKAGYNPIGEHVDDWERGAELQFQGHWTDRIKTGWNHWDHKAIGLPRGELVVLCGLPSMGKTQLALQLARNIASLLYQTNEPGCVAINSLEMTGVKLIQRLACAYAEVDSRYLYSGQITKGSPEYGRLKVETAKLRKLPLYIDDRDFMKSSAIELQASALHAERGPLRFLVIDFAELVGDTRGESEELRVSGIFRKAKGIAKTLNTTVMLLTQYNRSVSERNDKLGTNFDIRYSGFGEIAAGMIIHIYNPYQLQLMQTHVQPPMELPIQENTAYLIVGKNKDAPTSHWRMGWNPRYTHWFDESGEDFGESEEGDF